jgi:ATP-dependent helicase IRC3
VQTILMSLPPNVVVAGLDGEAVLRYDATDGVVSAVAAESQAKRLLRQARVLGAKLVIDNETLSITFRNPETDNERYAYLQWHLSRVTGRTVAYARPRTKRKTSSPLALLRSMLPDGCRVAALDTDTSRETIVADIAGLTPGEIAEIESDFQDEFGMRLDLKGQMSLF